MNKLFFVLAPWAILSAQEVHQEVVIRAQSSATGSLPRQAKVEVEKAMEVMIRSEIGSSTPVKNAPYSAEAVTETVQMLADGNRITRKNTVTQYRDGEGRTRTEFVLQSIGGLGDVEAGANRSVSINDPVAKVNYSLDLKKKTAWKMAGGPMGLFNLAVPGPGLPAPGMGRASGVVAITGHPGEGMVTRTFERQITPGGGSVAIAGAEPPFAFSSMVRSTSSSKPENTKVEELGSRNIEGVEAKGTRSTVTIPAGEVGNERELNIVSEKWYSEQLKTHVLTRHADPRFGETTHRLTNVRLGEPPPTLFEVPADFTIEEPAMRVQQIRKRLDDKRQEE